MATEKLTQNEIVIHQLMEGDPLTSKDIAEKTSGGNGLDLGTNEVSTILNKINKTDLGYFIKKKRKGRAFEYQMVDEARDMLTPDQAYGLSLKIGKSRYSLDQALEDHPVLRKYVKGAKRKTAASRKKTSVSPSTARAETTQKQKAHTAPGSVEDVLKGIMKIFAGDNDLNVNVDVRVRFER